MDTGEPHFCAEEFCFAAVEPVNRGHPLVVFFRNQPACLGTDSRTEEQILLPGCGQQSGLLVALMCVRVGNWIAGNGTVGARHKCQFG